VPLVSEMTGGSRSPVFGTVTGALVRDDLKWSSP
jgi:hypothetical protein